MQLSAVLTCRIATCRMNHASYAAVTPSQYPLPMSSKYLFFSILSYHTNIFPVAALLEPLLLLLLLCKPLVMLVAAAAAAV